MAGVLVGGEAKKRLAEAMRKTLNLPSTSFPMRANAAAREPQLHARVVTDVYAAQMATRLAAGRARFVLHDGPPFANGQLHMGHFLNKVLKDTINRYKLLRGFAIDYVPGWDCHGLPIEVKALGQLQQAAGDQLDRLSASEVRRLSRALARGAIEDQQRDFQRWGVLADWSGAEGAIYQTMAPEYEARQYDVLKKMVHDGLIFRGFKPVYWSPSSRTALAEAELEYQDDHVSHAAYIAFPVLDVADAQAKRVLEPFGDKLSTVIWTTTPWTIPSNQALSVNASLDYVVVAAPEGGRYYLVARDLVDKFAAALSKPEDGDSPVTLEILASVEGKRLQGSRFAHPLDAARESIVLLGDHVTTDAGTGVVHTAPGHGQDDYFVWIDYHQNRPRTDGDEPLVPYIRCPVDSHGKFTADAGADLAGLEVLGDGNAAVLVKLAASGNLLASNAFKHRYPYDWRSKKPVILRATAQWFAKLDSLHESGARVLDERAGETQFVPKTARRRLEATISSRSEWCISRQRAWGLPIPVFYHKESGDPLMTEETITHLQDVVRKYKADDGREGSDCWWDLPVDELLPPAMKSVADQYEKGMDTLDVWFDSGSSWHTVLKPQADSDVKRADVYLEGSDQHRGWFQSSLLTSLAMQKTAPYKHVITHGFTLDERGLKMSKSLGNTIAPREFIDGATLTLTDDAGGKKKKKKNAKPKTLKVPAYGVDVLRYWVASTDYTGDVSVGPSVVGKVSDALRKVRNTTRFLLANLNDFDPAKHAVTHAQMAPRGADRYMLHELAQLRESVTEAYETFAFSRVTHAVAHFISADLSSFYMEASKDRLYCDAHDSESRRAAQTVLWLSLQAISRAIAPIVPHAAEDMRLHLLSQLEGVPLEDVQGSIFLEEGWMPTASEWRDDELARDWQAIRHLRLDVNRLVEKLRAAGTVGSQLECNVFIIARDARVRELLGNCAALGGASALENVLLCSGVRVVADENELPTAAVEVGKSERGSSQLAVLGGQEVEVVVATAEGHKCPRCWKYAPEVDASEAQLCRRCAEATGLASVADLAQRLVEEE
jgi:isoleucyl-tRNA synthetase